jgi:hypothetical protein
VAYTFAGGALSRGGDLRWTLGYLAVAGVLIVLVSFIPRLRVSVIVNTQIAR